MQARVTNLAVKHQMVKKYNVVDANGKLVADLDRNNPTQRETYQKLTNLEWTGKNLGFANEVTANVYKLEHGRNSSSDQGNTYITKDVPKEIIDNVDTPSNMHVVAKGANINFDTEFNHGLLKGFGVDHTFIKIWHQLSPSRSRTAQKSKTWCGASRKKPMLVFI